MVKKISITGNDLKIEDVVAVTQDPEIHFEISSTTLKNAEKARSFLDEEIGKRVIYGVNTGFGPMASHIINPKNLLHLQENLVLSHAVGMGEPIADEFVLAAMVVRLNTLAKGYSGVSTELLIQLQTFINRRIIPIVPEHGAVGTSGDLVQLAHIALALIGRGKVRYDGKIQKTAEVLKKLKIKPYVLKPKEGLSLINGTSVMSGIGAMLCARAERLLDIATRNGALALELVAAFNDGISEALHDVRPHVGQRKIAKTLRTLLATSHLLRSRDVLNKHNGHNNYETQEIPEDVQEIYSLRCIPQILGPILDILTKVRKDVEIEINSVSDNPIIDLKNRQFLHGGNFHGDVVAAAMDQLKASLIKLTMLSERRTAFFLHHKNNRLFPPFLNLNKPGLTLALQGLQFVATSTTAQSQSLAFPHHIHSIPTNADNQDVVSMGTDAALMTSKVIDNAFIVLSIELIALTQAVDIREIKDRLSRDSHKMYDSIRKIFPAVTEDREMAEELGQVTNLLRHA